MVVALGHQDKQPRFMTLSFVAMLLLAVFLTRMMSR